MTTQELMNKKRKKCDCCDFPFDCTPNPYWVEQQVNRQKNREKYNEFIQERQNELYKIILENDTSYNWLFKEHFEQLKNDLSELLKKYRQSYDNARTD